jgi:hypothetical protein
MPSLKGRPDMQHSVSLVAQASLWVIIVVFALIMQVMPLLLILTLFNIAIGVSSTAMLIIIPVSLFGMLLVACSVAERRRRRMLPKPLPIRADRPHPDEAMRHTAACMLPYLRRSRFF